MGVSVSHRTSVTRWSSLRTPVSHPISPHPPEKTKTKKTILEIQKNKNKKETFFFFLVTAQLNYHGVEARTEVMGSDEDVVGAVGPIPKWVLGGY